MSTVTIPSLQIGKLSKVWREGVSVAMSQNLKRPGWHEPIQSGSRTCCPKTLWYLSSRYVFSKQHHVYWFAYPGFWEEDAPHIRWTSLPLESAILSSILTHQYRYWALVSAGSWRHRGLLANRGSGSTKLGPDPEDLTGVLLPPHEVDGHLSCHCPILCRSSFRGLSKCPNCPSHIPLSGQFLWRF